MEDLETQEVERLTRERDGLAKALRNLVKMNVEHNEAVESVIGRPVNWSDNYLDEARAALAALPTAPKEDDDA